MSKSKLTGDDAIAISMKELGFKTNPLGNCDGLISTFVEYVAYNEENIFLSSLDFIFNTIDLARKIGSFIKEFKIIIPKNYSDLLDEKKYEQEKEFKLAKQNLIFFNVVQIFKKISLYQNHNDFCTSELKYSLTSNQIVIPSEIKDISILRNALMQVYLDNIIYTPAEWCNYLENLRKIFREIYENYGDIFKLAMRISIWFEYSESTEVDLQDHAIGLYYSVKLDQWMLVDNTLLNIEKIPCPVVNLSEESLRLLDEKRVKN